jgi:hypothetical protein
LAADEVDKQYGGGKGIDMTKFTQFTSGPSPKSNSERSKIRKEERLLLNSPPNQARNPTQREV